MLQNVYQEQNVSCFSGLCSGGTAAIGQKRCQTVFADIFLRPGAANHNSCSQAWIWNIKTCTKKWWFTSVTFYLWWFLSSTWSEVTDGMAFGSIAVVAVNRRMTMMFGKRVGPFPTTHLSTSPKVIGPNWYFYQKVRDGFLLFFPTDKMIRMDFSDFFWQKIHSCWILKGILKDQELHEKMRDSMLRRWWSRCSHATNKFGPTGWLFEEIRNAGWGRGYELFSWFFIGFLYFFHTFLFLRCKAWW